MAISNNHIRADVAQGNDSTELDAIRNALKGLKYGNVNIIVQDGFIVQIERTEKHRLRQKSDPPQSARQTKQLENHDTRKSEPTHLPR